MPGRESSELQRNEERRVKHSPDSPFSHAPKGPRTLAMSPNLQDCQPAGRGLLPPQGNSRSGNLPKAQLPTTLCPSICLRDSSKLHHESQSLIHGSLVGKYRSHIGGQQDKVRAFPISVRILAPYAILEQFGQVVFRSKLVIHSSLLLQRSHHVSEGFVQPYLDPTQSRCPQRDRALHW